MEVAQEVGSEVWSALAYEASLFHRILYKNFNQHRGTQYFQALQKVKRKLMTIREAGPPWHRVHHTSLSTTALCWEALMKEEKTEIHVYLARLHAIIRATNSIEKATRCLGELLAQTFFMPLALTMVACMGRFHTLLLKLLKISVDTHHQRTKMSISQVAQRSLSQDSQMPHRLLLVSTSDHTIRLTVQEYSRQEVVELLPPPTPLSIPTPTPLSTLQSKAAAQAFLSFVSGETDEHLPNSGDTAVDVSAEAVWKPTSLQSGDVRGERGTSGQVCTDSNVDCPQPGSVYIVENTLNSDNVRDRARLTTACHVAQSVSLCLHAPSKTGGLVTSRNADSEDEGNRSLQDCSDRSSPVPLTLTLQDEMQRDTATLCDSISMPTKVGCDSLEGSNTISCGPKEGLHGDNEVVRPRKRKKEEDKSDRIVESPRRVARKGGEKDIFSMLLGGSENEDLF